MSLMIPLIILCALSVPLAKIFSSTYIRGKEIDAEARLQELRELGAAQDDIVKRIQVLETIAVDDVGFLPAHPKDQTAQMALPAGQRSEHERPE